MTVVGNTCNLIGENGVEHLALFLLVFSAHGEIRLDDVLAEGTSERRALMSAGNRVRSPPSSALIFVAL